MPVRAAQSSLFRCLALAVLAGGAALISNALAPSSRRLAWTALVPTPTHVSTGPPAPGPPSPPPLVSAPTRRAPPRPAAPAPPPRSPTTAAPISEIDSQAAWAAFQVGQPFLDARRSEAFADGHIAGAWCAPVWESDLEDRLLSFKAARRPGAEDPIVLYCGGGDCRDAHLLAERLLSQGYSRLLVYRDGFPDWVAKGRPVEKGLP